MVGAVQVMNHSSNAVRLALAANITIATGTDCPGDCTQAWLFAAMFLPVIFTHITIVGFLFSFVFACWAGAQI